MKAYARLCAILLPALCFSLLFRAPAISSPLDSYISAARKERSVRVGVTLRKKRFGKPAGEKYIRAFERRYPFLQAELKRIGGSRERERVLAEMTAGLIHYDVVTISDTMANTVIQAHLARMIDWRGLGVPKFLIHPKNLGISLRTQVYGIAYNRELVSDRVAQSFTWETCTDPEWRGKAAMDDRPQHLRVFYQESAWGREKTLDYAKRWAANKPSVEASRSTAAQKLAVGAYYLICGQTRKQIMELNRFAGVRSIGIVYPEPIPVSSGDLLYVPRKAKHPNAAVLFLAWTATGEAQRILDEVDFTGHPSFPGNEISKVLKGKKTVSLSPEYVLRADEILAEILRAMGFPVVR